MVDRPPHTETDQMLNVYMHDICPDTAALMHAAAPSASPGIAKALGIDTILHTTCDVCCRCVRPPARLVPEAASDAAASASASAALAPGRTTPASPLLNSIRLPPQFPLANASPASLPTSLPSAPLAAPPPPPLPSAVASASCPCRRPPTLPVIQDYVFAPCGWSMNGMLGDVYVTPSSLTLFL
jgi:hypothetical protein